MQRPPLENVASTRHTGAYSPTVCTAPPRKLLVVARAGFAAEEHEVMKAGGKTITAAETSAIEE